MGAAAARSLAGIVAVAGLSVSVVSGQRLLQVQRLAKATPDECFDGVGAPYPPGAPQCAQGGTPRVNSSYVWSLTKSGNRLWFGTVSNIFCQSRGTNFGETDPIHTPGLVCEFGASYFVTQFPNLPPQMGDWRPPAIYSYDLDAPPAEALVLRTASLPPLDRFRLNTTVGFRSAAAADNVVLLGGPTLYGRVNLFAFRADTGEFLGSRTLAPYSNIRQWREANGVLYVGVIQRGGGGQVLRWVGDANNPFRFVVVGNVDAFPANMTLHENRLYLTTWPRLVGERTPTGLWVSPPIPPGGLNSLHANAWEKVWSFDAYEPDPVVANSYGGGAIASFGEWVYWGSMHIPEAAIVAWEAAYGPPVDADEEQAVRDGTRRALSIFRGRLTDSGAFETQLLYGESELPVFDPVSREFSPMPTGMGSPLYGPSGFGNGLNNYTWAMQVFQDRLYVGTLDQSYFTYDMSEFIGVPRPVLWLLLSPYFGADLWRFDSTQTAAVPEDLNGLGNYTNWGVRTMIADEQALYVGTANPQNLLTDPTDNIPEGGWELLRLTPIAPSP